MTNALSIPLFHFPPLVYERIIELMCMKAKFQLASLSEQAAIIVRQIMKKQSIKMVIRFEVHTATVILSKDEFDMKLASWSYDLQTSAKLMVYEISKIKNVIQLSSFKLVFWQPLFNDFNFFHSWFIENTNLEPNYVEAVKSAPNDELCEVLFKKFKNSQQLVMHCETTPGFTITPDEMGQYSLENLIIGNASWLTVNHLTKCFLNCKKVELDYFTWSPQEQNFFIKAWIEQSKMQSLCYNLGDLDFEVEEVLKGIPFAICESAWNVLSSAWKSRVDNGYLFHKANGIPALIFEKHEKVCLVTNFYTDT